MTCSKCNKPFHNLTYHAREIYDVEAEAVILFADAETVNIYNMKGVTIASSIIEQFLCPNCGEILARDAKEAAKLLREEARVVVAA